MKIPFAKTLELAHVRKALAGGFATACGLLADDLIHQHLTRTDVEWIVGAFIAGVLLVYKVPNKDLPGAVRVADMFLGDVMPAAVPVFDEIAKATEQTVAAAPATAPAAPSSLSVTSTSPLVVTTPDPTAATPTQAAGQG
jgi:hypothetical protein